MSILSRLFGRKPDAGPPADVAPPSDRLDVHRGFDVEANSDIFASYQFCATLQLRTPLRVLRRHGEVHKNLHREPPAIARQMWEGVWIPVTRTFRELGLDIDEPRISTMASDIGPIPTDGGNYLKFLIEVREAAEGDGGIEDRRAAVAKVFRDPAWRKTVRSLDGPDAALGKLFPPFVSTVPRIPSKVALALIEAGYSSPAAISAASDAQLRGIAGVGPGTIASLRSEASQASDRDAKFVDRVIR